MLHPVDPCAGRPCIVETVDGDRAETAFPARVSPHQPFRNVRAILHEVSPGVEVEVRMEGETFETEDQCNWGDASFKTYGTPLHLPFPARVATGARLEQSVTVSIFGITAAPVEQAAARVPGAVHKKRNSTEPVVVAVAPGEGVALPALGLCGAGQLALGEAETKHLRPLRLAHLRADLELGGSEWDERLERAAANAALVGAPLELAVFLPEDPRSSLAQLAKRTAGAEAEASRAGFSTPRPTASRPKATSRWPAPCSRRRRPARSSAAAPTRTSPSSTGAGRFPACSTSWSTRSTRRRTPSTTRRSSRASRACGAWPTRCAASPAERPSASRP